MKNFVLTLFVSLFLSLQITAQVQVSLPELNYSSPIGTVIEIPVSCGDLTGLNVIAYQFIFTFNSEVLIPEAPYYSTSGTLSGANGWTVMVNEAVQNQLSVGAFGASSFSGGGTLVKLIFKVNTGCGNTPLELTNFYFNAGNPAVILNNGSFSNQNCSGQTLVIPAGWSGISAYVEPSDPNMVNMFAPIQSKLAMVNNFTNSYSPIFGVNPTQPWSSNSGYFIKLTEPAQIQILGDETQTKVVNLVTGWNLVPILSNCVYFCEEIMYGLNFEIVQEVAGMNVYWPSKNVQTLYFFESGKAYLIKMNSTGSITFPSCK